MASYNFKIKFDEYAESYKRYILCVHKGRTSVEVPRFATLYDALEAAANYLLYNNITGDVNIKISLRKNV